MTNEVRVVVNQIGVAIELHKADSAPIVLGLFSPEQVSAYGKRLANQNPDMRYSSIGQIALQMAREIVRADCHLSPYVWTYNATTNEYSAGVS